MANDIIQKKEQAMQNGNGGKTLKEYIKIMEPEIKKALPSTISSERFTRMLVTSVSMNPKLAECSPISFIAAAMTAAQLGVTVNDPLGMSYIIPYRVHGKMQCNFQLGYRGLLNLAYRSGEIKSISAQIVYENDKFECEFGINPILRHVPADGERGNPVKAYAIYTTVNDGYGFDVMTIDEIKEHARKYSKNYGDGSSPWSTNFESMCLKTVLRRALKYAPLSTEFMSQIATDNTVKNRISEHMDEIENIIDYTEIADEQQNEEQTESK